MKNLRGRYDEAKNQLRMYDANLKFGIYDVDEYPYGVIPISSTENLVLDLDEQTLVLQEEGQPDLDLELKLI